MGKEKKGEKVEEKVKEKVKETVGEEEVEKAVVEDVLCIWKTIPLSRPPKRQRLPRPLRLGRRAYRSSQILPTTSQVNP